MILVLCDTTLHQVNAAYLAELEAEKEKLEAAAQSEDNNSSTTSSHLLRLLENGSSENFLNSLMLIISPWQKLVTYKVEEEELPHSGNTSSISTSTGIIHLPELIHFQASIYEYDHCSKIGRYEIL